MNASDSLSKRSEILHNWSDFLVKFFTLCSADPYDSESNPSGYINFGTAVNNLSNDLILPKITSDEIWHCDKTLLGYGESHGSMRLRKALANLMTEFFNTNEPVDPDNLICTVGVTSSIDILAHCIADPGDVILTPTPVYARIYTDLLQRSLVEMWPIPIISKDNAESEPQLTLEKVEAAYTEAEKNGKRIKAILLLNPSNPLGDIYDEKLLTEILEFCYRKKLHVIVDEVYALSVYNNDCNFKSILSFSTLPDVQRTHVLYGMSKDFALAGLRIGAIHTWNSVLKQCLIELSQFYQIPFPVMNSAAKLWEDLEWCKMFVQINKQRLQLQFDFFKKYLEGIGLHVRKSKSAFFLWVDFREKCQIKTFSEEISFFHYLIEKFHIYIVPGKEMFCEQPGWFRITFTSNPKHAEIGLKKIAEALQQFSTFSHLENDLDTLNVIEKPEEESLENLVLHLRNKIVESDWLSENTADQWVVENPELSKFFIDKS